MAKVFATLVENGLVVLNTWSSAAQFGKTESWVDEKFIYVAISTDFKETWDSEAMYTDDLEPALTDKPPKGSFEFVYSDNQRAAHALMCEARRKYLGIKE